MGNCCCSKNNIRPITILLLGSESSGKTEIGHVLAGDKRIDYTSTKGVHMFNINVKNQPIKLMEIGGSDSVRGIWPHYYNEIYGVVYVIDCSIESPFELMRDILHKTMNHKHIRGKPLLIVANKQDMNDSIDVVDITYFFRIDEMCNLLSTPCLIVTSGENCRNDLTFGMEWIVGHISDNYKMLRNRIRFNRLLVSPVKRFSRQRTSLPQKRSKIKPETRIRSAPSSVGLGRSPRLSNQMGQLSQMKLVAEETTLFQLKTIVIQHE